MNKNYIFSVLLLCLGISAMAQVPNGGFEIKDSVILNSTIINWSTKGSAYYTNFGDEGVTVSSYNAEEGLLISDINTTDFSKARGFELNARPDSLLILMDYFLETGDTIIIQTKNRETGNDFGSGILKLFGNSQALAKTFKVNIDYTSPGIADSAVIMINIKSANAANESSFTVYSMKFVNISGNETGSLPNKEFNNWNKQKFITPQHWTTSNTLALTLFGEVLTSPELVSQAQAGSNALKLEVKNLDGGAANAYAYSAPFEEIYTIDLDNPVPTFPVTKNHNELKGYYKFTPVGGDEAVIQVNMFKNGVAVGSGKKLFTGSQSSYTSFSIPITYTSTNVIPDSSIIQIYASDPDGSTTLGTALWVDELQLTGGTNSLTEIDNLKLNIYPNPSIGSLNLQIANETIGKVDIFNVNGVLVYTLNNIETNKLLQINEDFATGNYLIKVTTNKGNYSKIINITK